MDKVLDRLTKELKKAFGDGLVSVVLYGSAAAGDHHEGFSDYNILCVLERLTPAELGRAEEVFAWWRRQGNPAPLLLTQHELATSTDCFAIEFHDIKRHHRVLYGKDVVSPLEVGGSFYRALVEHDLRAKLLRLRQKASGMLSDKNLLRRLLADSVSTFAVLLRHALALHGVEAGPGRRGVVEAARQTFGMDPRPFATLLDLREKRVRPRDVEPVALLGAYLESIGTVIDAVDRLEK
jgi:hypothetical protein